MAKSNYAESGRNALRMARAFTHFRKMRIIWQERAADYRECLIDEKRRQQGWTLAERIANQRIA